MQGTLNEIDIRSILQLIELGQRTGELWVEAHAPSPPFWLVFFVNGRIVYAADRHSQQLDRLQDYLHRAKPGSIPEPLASAGPPGASIPEYVHLWRLLEKQAIEPARGRRILESLVREILFELLSLHQGSFSFEMGAGLTPQLTSLKVAPLVAQMMQQVQQWKQFYPHIQSPQQCLAIGDESQLRATLSDPVYQCLSRWADGQTSLHQLCRYLDRDLSTLARAIYPYVERGWLHLVGAGPQPQSWNLDGAPRSPHIACIEGEAAVRRQVAALSDRLGWRHTLISDPIQALSLLFSCQPDLILCSLTLPQLDGAEICGMLRHSRTFRRLPIILLVDRESFGDRVRGRMAGATDYLAKPFKEQELLRLLEKYFPIPRSRAQEKVERETIGAN